MQASTQSPQTPVPASFVRRPSHPLFVTCPVDIFSKHDVVAVPGAVFGHHYGYNSALVYIDEHQGIEKGVKIIASGYGTSTTLLHEEKVYLISGRFLAPNSKTSPYIYFNQEQSMLLADSHGFTGSFANKASAVGFGIVMTRKIVNQATSSGIVENLLVTMEHSDYDNRTRENVTFLVQYWLSGARNLHKTFGLFRAGREFVISGYVSGYDRDACMWVVHGLNISMGTGHHESKTMAAELSLPKRLGRGGVNILDLEAESASPVASSSRHVSQNPVASGSGVAPQEDGEVLEPPPQGESNAEGFANTFPKKRTGKEVIRDARKSLKYSN